MLFLTQMHQNLHRLFLERSGAKSNINQENYMSDDTVKREMRLSLIVKTKYAQITEDSTNRYCLGSFY